MERMEEKIDCFYFFLHHFMDFLCFIVCFAALLGVYTQKSKQYFADSEDYFRSCEESGDLFSFMAVFALLCGLGFLEWMLGTF